MPIYTLEELTAARPSGKPSIVGDGLLPRNGSLLLIGETETGKSVVAFDIAFCLALGKPLFGAFRKKHGVVGTPFYPTHRAMRVLYVDTELGPDGCYDRLQLFVPRYCSGMTLGEQFRFATGENKPILLHNIKDGPDKPYDNMRALFEELRPEIVVLDPLAQFHCVDENGSVMNMVLGNLKRLQHELNFAVVLIHHESDKEFVDTKTGKAVAKSDSTARSRGHSSITAWADTVLRVQREGKEHASTQGYLRMAWVKKRHGVKAKPFFCWVDFERMVVHWVCSETAGYADTKSKFKALYEQKYPPIREEEIELPVLP